MVKFCQCLTELSARDMIMAGYSSFYFGIMNFVIFYSSNITFAMIISILWTEFHLQLWTLKAHQAMEAVRCISNDCCCCTSYRQLMPLFCWL